MWQVSLLILKISLLSPFLKDPKSLVIVFKPILLRKFSNGKNSPNGTRLVLSYFWIWLRLLSINTNELKYSFLFSFKGKS